MKKILLILIMMVGVLGAVDKFNMNVGLANTMNSEIDNGPNLYHSIYFLNEDQGFIYGAGGGYLFYENPERMPGVKTYAYLIGPEVMLGYEVGRLSFKATYGLEVHRISSKNYWGNSVSAGADVHLYDQFGLGFKVKRWKANYEGGFYGTSYITYLDFKIGATK
jgi:hypothetical protein